MNDIDMMRNYTFIDEFKHTYIDRYLEQIC